jgi:nitroreductase
MFKDIVKKRRSVSKFEKKGVSNKIIDDIISLSSYAPSSCNTQPWYFLVFSTEKSKSRLNELIDKGYEQTYKKLRKRHLILGRVYTKFLDTFSKYGKFDKAPTYILVFAKPYDAPFLSKAINLAKDEQINKLAKDSVTTSVAMAIQNFLLIAHSKGLGTRVKDGIKFLMHFENLKKDFYKEFKIPSEYELVSGIQLGYPTKEEEKKKPAKRNSLNKIRRYI